MKFLKRYIGFCTCIDMCMIISGCCPWNSLEESSLCLKLVCLFIHDEIDCYYELANYPWFPWDQIDFGSFEIHPIFKVYYQYTFWNFWNLSASNRTHTWSLLIEEMPSPLATLDTNTRIMLSAVYCKIKINCAAEAILLACKIQHNTFFF